MAASKFTTYQCSICRRQKDLPTDSVRALLNECIITKGCSGRLFAVGERTDARQTPPVSGVEDWYARGTEFSTEPTEVTVEPVELSCSTGGTLVLALLLPTATWDATPTVTVTFEARRINDVGLSQFNYRVSAPTTVISGPDLAGITLRFDAQAIAGSRVQVRVNGVLREVGTDFTLTPNVVTFTSPLATADAVSVIVFQDEIVRDETFTFTQNEDLTDTVTSAWQNVRFCEQGTYRSLPAGRDRWFTYSMSATALQRLVISSRLRLKAITSILPAELGTRAKFLLATTPYAGPDRVLNLAASGQELSESFVTIVTGTSGAKRLSVDPSAVKELFPPLQLTYESTLPTLPPKASFIDAAAERTTTAASSAIPQDTSLAPVTGTIILGPV